MGKFVDVLKASRAPMYTVKYVMSIFKGWYIVFIKNLFGNRIIAGKKLKIEGKVIFYGKGKIVIGDNVLLVGTMNSVCTPWTYHEKAVLSIGSNSFLNGTRISCRNSIEIGRDCIIGDARIADNDGHSIAINRHEIHSDELETRPVIIEENVWIGAGVFILKGSRIGRNSVIGAGSVVSGIIPANVVAAGNPCKVVKKLTNQSSNSFIEPKSS